MSRESKTLSMPEPLWKKLIKEAGAKGRTLSGHVAEIVRDHYADQDKKKEEALQSSQQ